MAGFADCWYTAEIRNSSSGTATLANDIALCVVNTLAVLLNVLANGAVVHVYLTSSRARQPVSNILLFVLSVFQLLQGTLSHPLFIAMKILESCKNSPCKLNAASKVMNGTFAGFSFFIVSYLLTSERLFAIVFPIRHRIFARKRCILGTSVIMFLVWAVLVVFLQLLWKKSLLFQAVTLTFIAGGLAYSVAVYIKIYCIVRKSARAALAGTTSRASGSNRAINDNKKAFHIKATSSERSERRLGTTKGKEVAGRKNENEGWDVSKIETSVDIKWSSHDREVANEQELDRFAPDIGNRPSKHLEIVSEDSSGAQYAGYDTDNCIIDADGDGDAMTSTRSVPCDFDEKSQGMQNAASPCCRNKCVKQVHDAFQNFSLSRRERRTILRMLCIVGALYVTHFPVLLHFIYVSRHGVDAFFVKYFYPWASTFAFSCTIINPFIYCYRNEHFWIRKSFGKSVHHRHTIGTSSVHHR